MQVPIKEIHVKEGRRRLQAEQVAGLADSIRELGLLNPVTIDQGCNLIAGLYRLEAAKQLGWTEMECTVSSLEGLQAELAEIDENFVRNGLSAVEYGEMLLRRKEVYEMLHPETKATYNGGSFRGNQHKNMVADKMSPTTKSFVQDTASRLGVAPRTVERQIRTARKLTPETKGIIRDAGTKVDKKTAMELSRLEPGQQKEAAALLAAGEIRKVGEYTAGAGKTAATVKPLAEPEPPGAAEGQAAEKPKRPGTAGGQAPGSGQSGRACAGQPETGPGGSVYREPGKAYMKQAGQGRGKRQDEAATQPEKPDPPAGAVPEGCRAGLKEIIAELKDPDKDCSGTPESFLAEYGAFVRKFHREIGWYGHPYYDRVYPDFTEAQLAQFRQLTDSICSAAREMFHRAERKRKG